MRRNKNKVKILKRTVLTSSINVRRVRTRDITTSFKFKRKGVKTKENKLTSCTIINNEDADGSYMIFKRRINGTWELIMSEDLSEIIDEIESIDIYHDRHLKDL